MDVKITQTLTNSTQSSMDVKIELEELTLEASRSRLTASGQSKSGNKEVLKDRLRETYAAQSISFGVPVIIFLKK